jgi:hypothetical protein
MKTIKVNPKLVAMAILCSIDIGGIYSEVISKWASSKEVMSLLPIKIRNKTAKHLFLAVKSSKEAGETFKESKAWTVFAENAKIFPFVGDEENPSEIEIPVSIFAVAVFYAANVGGEIENAVLEVFKNSGITKISTKDFNGLLDLEIPYNADFISNFTEDKQITQEKLESEEYNCEEEIQEDVMVGKYIAPKEEVRPAPMIHTEKATSTLGALYDAVGTMDYDKVNDILSSTPFPSMIILELSTTPLFNTLFGMLEELKDKKIKNIVASFGYSEAQIVASA